MPHDDSIEDHLVVEGELVLTEHCDPLAGTHGDLPLVSLNLARKDLEKGGFAGAVGADEAIAVAGGELDVHVLEENPLAVGEGDVGCADHALV